MKRLAHHDLFYSYFEFLNQLKLETETFSDLQDLYAQLNTNPERVTLFKCYNGIIYLGGKPVISKSLNLEKRFVEEFHSTPTGGHSDVSKSLRRLRPNVYWKEHRRILRTLLQIVLPVSK